MGIGHPGPVYNIAEYVLEEFPPDEWEKFAPVLEVAVEAIRVLVAEIEAAIADHFNRRNQRSRDREIPLSLLGIFCWNNLSFAFAGVYIEV